MRILTCVFIFLFTLFAVVVPLHADDDTYEETFYVIKSIIPDIRSECRYIINMETGEIENSSCQPARIITIILIPQSLEPSEADDVVSLQLEAAQLQVGSVATMLKFRAYVELDPQAVANQLTNIGQAIERPEPPGAPFSDNAYMEAMQWLLEENEYNQSDFRISGVLQKKTDIIIP